MASLRKLSLIKNGRSNLCLHDGRKANQLDIRNQGRERLKKAEGDPYEQMNN